MRVEFSCLAVHPVATGAFRQAVVCQMLCYIVLSCSAVLPNMSKKSSSQLSTLLYMQKLVDFTQPDMKLQCDCGQHQISHTQVFTAGVALNNCKESLCQELALLKLIADLRPRAL